MAGIRAALGAGTDHELRQRIGLPAFPFIQDPRDNSPNVHHSSLDTFDHLRAEDMRQAQAVRPVPVRRSPRPVVKARSRREVEQPALAAPGVAAYLPAMRHDHHVEAGPALADAARATLEGRGEQWTAMRATVFDALAGFEKPASAYDVAEAVSQAEGRRVAANTIYRILDVFVATNLALRVESANAYVANTHPGCVHDCIFLVCDICGQTTHVDDDRLANGVRDAARQVGFTPIRPVIEVRGRCVGCASH